MNFVSADKKYLEECVKIGIKAYEEECEKCNNLIKADFTEEIREQITNLIQNGRGIIAIESGNVIGYFLYWAPIDGFLGNCRGGYSPLAGNAYTGDNRARLASMLFEHAAEAEIQRGVTSFALTRYAHDDEVNKNFVFNGFGIRCSDLIIKLKERNIIKPASGELVYRELEKSEFTGIDRLRRGLIEHLSKAPVLYPSNLSDYMGWYESNIRIFAAFSGYKMVGYISVRDTAETFISEHKDMMNICGAYMDTSCRGTGAMDGFLEYVCSILEKEGNTYLGVDCETLNPTAINYWNKHFNCYTYSFARRVDERIIGYDEYMRSGFYRLSV